MRAHLRNTDRFAPQHSLGRLVRRKRDLVPARRDCDSDRFSKISVYMYLSYQKKTLKTYGRFPPSLCTPEMGAADTHTNHMDSMEGATYESPIVVDDTEYFVEHEDEERLFEVKYINLVSHVNKINNAVVKAEACVMIAKEAGRFDYPTHDNTYVPGTECEFMNSVKWLRSGKIHQSWRAASIPRFLYDGDSTDGNLVAIIFAIKQYDRKRPRE